MAQGLANRLLQPSGTTAPLSMRTCAVYEHSRALRGAMSTSGRDDVSGPRVHVLRHRATLPETAGSSHPHCPWHTARPISGCDRPGQWDNQRAIIGYPHRRGHARVCGGSARIFMLLKRRWRSLPMCLAAAWTGRSTSSRVTRGTTACRSSSVTHVRTSVPKRPRPARSWRVASVTVSVSTKSRPHSGGDRTC